jgi:hypothetical protein
MKFLAQLTASKIFKKYSYYILAKKQVLLPIKIAIATKYRQKAIALSYNRQTLNLN